jgi:acetylornithine/succinyldiaminopimelate/putrescine aminotransferase
MSEYENIEQARKHRAGMRTAIGLVERALSTAAHGRVAAWSADLRAELTNLSEALDSHIELTEASDGLLADIAAAAPRLQHRVDKAREDHVVLRAAVARALEILPPPDSSEAGVQRARDRVVELLTALVRHRHLGADLVYEAYNVDIEAAD